MAGGRGARRRGGRRRAARRAGAAHGPVTGRTGDRPRRPAGVRAQLDTAWRLAEHQQTAEVTADLHLAEANLGLCAGQLDRARDAIDQALAATDDAPRLLARICLTDLRSEADLAENGRWSAAARRTVSDRAEVRHQQLAELQAGSTSSEIEAYCLTGIGEFGRCGLQTDAGPWREAAEAWAALERPRGQAYALIRAAEAQLRSHHAKSAVEPLRLGYAVADRLGCKPLTDLAATIALQARISLDDTTARRGDSREASRLGLTARETQILRELTLGLSNRDIAAKLYLSHRTVGVHVSNILSKLNARTRTEAATAAMRMHLVGAESTDQG